MTISYFHADTQQMRYTGIRQVNHDSDEGRARPIRTVPTDHEAYIMSVKPPLEVVAVNEKRLSKPVNANDSRGLNQYVLIPGHSNISTSNIGTEILKDLKKKSDPYFQKMFQ